MKVKDLRRKLADFAEKNRRHYEMTQNPPAELHHNDGCRIERPKRTPSVEEVEALGIDTKLSTASTSPSSSCDDALSPPSASTTPTFLGPYLHKNGTVAGDTVPQSYSFDSTSYAGSSGSGSTLRPPPQYSSSAGLDHVIGNEHLVLLDKQAPTVFNSMSLDEEEDFSEEQVFQDNATGSMHSARLLQGSLLTKSTLDAICRDHDRNDVGVPHTTSSTAASVRSADPSVSDETNSTRSTYNKHSDTAPSIAPGALVSQMATIFLNDRNNKYEPTSACCKQSKPLDLPILNAKSDSTREKGIKENAVVARRKTITPEDLPFLNPTKDLSNEMKPVIARRKTISPDDLPFLKASTRTSTPDKILDEITPKPRNTTVGTGVRKFGGRLSRVERRKEELNKKWAETKPTVLVKKVTWDVCKTTGTYKRKIIVEKEVKEEP